MHADYLTLAHHPRGEATVSPGMTREPSLTGSFCRRNQFNRTCRCTKIKTAAAVPSLANILALAAGTQHTGALLGDGTVRCWGENGLGQLGDGTNTDHSTLFQVTKITNAIAIAAGNAHTCAVLADGTARCWGNGTSGQIDNGGITDSTIPLQVSTSSNVVTIVAAEQHSCALRSDGTVGGWGKNNSGQLGNGNTTDQVIPAQVAKSTNVSAIAAGNHGIHTCALRVNGASQCRGANNAAPDQRRDH